MMIGKAIERCARQRGMDQPARDIRAARHQERGVKQSGRGLRFQRRIGPMDQMQQRDAVDAEHDLGVALADGAELEQIRVVGPHLAEIANTKRGGTDPHRRLLREGQRRDR